MLKHRKSALMVLTLLGLAACGDDANKGNASQASQPETSTLTASCQEPAVVPYVREMLQKTVRDEALKLAGKNYAQLIDADKLMAAAGLLEIELTQISGQSHACTAQLTVRVPRRVADVAQKYAPILNMDSPNKIMQQRFSGSNAVWQNHTLTLPLGYAVARNQQQFVMTYSDTTLNRVGTALSVMLQPYGVKDTLSINGKTMSREQAIEWMNQPKPLAPSEPEETVKEVPTLSENTESPQTTPSSPVAPPPEVKPKPQSQVTDEQLSAARQAHQAADSDIKQAWRILDPVVQQSLLEEQKTWESQKRQRCLKRAAQGATDEDAAYLHMKCDTQLTHERIKYLQGYGIQ